MEFVKDRTLAPGDIVHVYKNLNRECFSIKNKKTGLVVAYCQSCTITNAKFHVSASGLLRVRSKQVRAVMAWVEGVFVQADEEKPEAVFASAAAFHVGYFNPYKTDTFIDEGAGTPVHRAAIAHFANDRVLFAQQEREEQLSLFTWGDTDGH